MSPLSEDTRGRLGAFCSDRLGAPLIDVRVLSETNNLVVLATLKTGAEVVIKLLTDEDLDADFLRHCSEALANAVPVARVLDIDVSRKHFDVDVVVVEPISGESAADRWARGAMTEEAEAALIDLYLATFRACQSITLPTEGFGLYKKGRPMQATTGEFIHFFVDRLCNRVGDVTSERDVWSGRAALLHGVFEGEIAPSLSRTAVTPVDMNLKNIVFRGPREPVLLNAPILARSDERHGLGAMAAIFASTNTREVFSRRVAESLSLAGLTPRALVFYEALTLLHILTFYARQGPGALREARMWGTGAPLYEEAQKALLSLR